MSAQENVTNNPAAPAAKPAEGTSSHPHAGAGGAPSRYPSSNRYGSRPSGDRMGGGRGMRRGGPIRRKVCRFCAEKVFEVDFKAIHVIRSFMTARGKLLSGRTTGNCAKHQRQVTIAVKRAQNIALLPTMGE